MLDLETEQDCLAQRQMGQGNPESACTKFEIQCAFAHGEPHIGKDSAHLRSGAVIYAVQDPLNHLI